MGWKTMVQFLVWEGLHTSSPRPGWFRNLPGFFPMGTGWSFGVKRPECEANNSPASIITREAFQAYPCTPSTRGAWEQRQIMFKISVPTSND